MNNAILKIAFLDSFEDKFSSLSALNSMTKL